ncbi:MAG: RNA-binding domain-containing protein [Planctomycetota bacterium]
MTEHDILQALNVGEDTDWEFKSAKGGIPGSLWETYSGMANTDGGTIVLGVSQHDDAFVVDGLDDPRKAKRNFWDTVNNRGKASLNLLSDEQVAIREIAGKNILVIQVPRATRHEQPVYVGQNPVTGTYRRNFEGDYHCTQKEVGRMLADQADESGDSLILEHFNFTDLDVDSLQQYRQRFSARSPDHPWLGEQLNGFLAKLGGWRTERATGIEGPTVAGLLMFGKDEAMRDPAAVPGFHLDYRERLSDDPAVRWTDRLTYDGTWVCNLFQFYQRVIRKLTVDLKIPFRLQPDLFRKDDTIVHEAIREAVVNALIHADYRGEGGVVIEKYRDRFELSNPGTLLLPFEQILTGGVSECRNKTLQTMFLMIGGGEKAGSGIDKIRQGWKSQHWRFPRIQTGFRPDRVKMTLPMVSLLPEESVNRLHQRFGTRFDGLAPAEVQALVTADLEGAVCNSRLREVCGEHPADLTRTLQGLVARGYLEQKGQKRGAAYRLPGEVTGAAAGGGILHRPTDILLNTKNILPSPENIPPKTAEPAPGPENDAILLAIARPSRESKRLPPNEIGDIILKLCHGRYLTLKQIAVLLNRNPESLRSRLLTSLVEKGDLTMLFPGEPKRPGQAYTSRIDAAGSDGTTIRPKLT